MKQSGITRSCWLCSPRRLHSLLHTYICIYYWRHYWHCYASFWVRSSPLYFERFFGPLIFFCKSFSFNHYSGNNTGCKISLQAHLSCCNRLISFYYIVFLGDGDVYLFFFLVRVAEVVFGGMCVCVLAEVGYLLFFFFYGVYVCTNA